MVYDSPEYNEYTDTHVSKSTAEVVVRCTELPEHFLPFGLSVSPTSAPYLSYITNRGLSKHTVALYRLGYADEGSFKGRIIMPSFDAHGMINFFSARTIHNIKPTYMLPDATKDIISNEHMIDWTKPIYLVEGMFDEMAIGCQAISLYGKFMLHRLALKIVDKKPPMVYVCLDVDARYEAMSLMKRLVGYDVQCSLLDLKGKDPAVVGASGVADAVELSRSVTGSMGLIAVKGRL